VSAAISQILTRLGTPIALPNSIAGPLAFVLPLIPLEGGEPLALSGVGAMFVRTKPITTGGRVEQIAPQKPEIANPELLGFLPYIHRHGVEFDYLWLCPACQQVSDPPVSRDINSTASHVAEMRKPTLV
jgi:hypothetical protein